MMNTSSPFDWSTLFEMLDNFILTPQERLEYESHIERLKTEQTAILTQAQQQSA